MIENDWITDLKNSSISDDKIDQLRSLVDHKRQKGGREEVVSYPNLFPYCNDACSFYWVLEYS
jgi:hypothetical protein